MTLPKAPPSRADVTSRPQRLRPLRLSHSRSSPPQAQGPRTSPSLLGTRGSHRKSPRSWDVAFLGPRHIRPIRRRVLTLPTSPAGSLLSDSSRPLLLQNHQLRFPPSWSPAHRAPTGLLPSAQGTVWGGDRSETRRAPPPPLLSREYFLNALIPATESGLSVPLQV